MVHHNERQDEIRLSGINYVSTMIYCFVRGTVIRTCVSYLMYGTVPYVQRLL